MRTESFMGHDIGLYEHNGECVWVLEDICNSLELDCNFPMDKDDIVLVDDNGTMMSRDCLFLWASKNVSVIFLLILLRISGL